MIRRVTKYYQQLTFETFCRKVLHTFIGFFSWRIFRKIKSWIYFNNSSVNLGKNIHIHGVSFNIKVGSHATFFDNCVFEFSNDADICIGSNVVFSYGVLLSSKKKIYIGNDVQIGEYSSLRDSTHRYDRSDKPMKYQQDILDSILIGNDVWIGRNCLVLPGTIIEDGVVVAAHSVVKGKLEKNGIYGGVPVKLIKYREANQIV